MVLYGKTTYPGKVIDRHLDVGNPIPTIPHPNPNKDGDQMAYLIRYDGLGTNRAEWRRHTELISIHEVSSARRRASRHGRNGQSGQSMYLT